MRRAGYNSLAGPRYRMPTVDENKHIWEHYDWGERGEEWSRSWGSSAAQWSASILPRIQQFIPTGTILEIASGYGRWTHFLVSQCDRLTGVDLNPECVKACQQRFAANAVASFFVTDGTSLAMIPDDSIDFVFSFDSLVHAEADVIEAYLRQLASKMKPDAVGFIHHSNLGVYSKPLAALQRDAAAAIDPVIDVALRRLVQLPHNRAPTVTAASFEQACSRTGLACIAQECINWEDYGVLLDCLSTFTPNGSRWARPNRVVGNMRFMQMKRPESVPASLYGDDSPAGASG